VPVPTHSNQLVRLCWPHHENASDIIGCLLTVFWPTQQFTKGLYIFFHPNTCPLFLMKIQTLITNTAQIWCTRSIEFHQAAPTETLW